MRALLLYNPNATTTTPAVTDVIARALSAELELEVVATERRDHAGQLATAAAEDGFETLIALGGDGTVNEVIQGLAHTEVKLALIPGGQTNVWARSLGLPNDAVEATGVVLDRLTRKQQRRVNLGAANDRYFAFAAGYGYDADVVRHVEQRAWLKHSIRQVSFLLAGAWAYLATYDRRRTRIRLTVPGAEPVEDLRTVVCCNCRPFTYLGRWPAELCPAASLDAGLDLTALTKVTVPGLVRLAQLALSGGSIERLRMVRLWHDQESVQLSNDVPLPLQVDGDYVGDTTQVRLRSVTKALTVVA